MDAVLGLIECQVGKGKVYGYYRHYVQVVLYYQVKECISISQGAILQHEEPLLLPTILQNQLQLLRLRILYYIPHFKLHFPNLPRLRHHLARLPIHLKVRLLHRKYQCLGHHRPIIKQLRCELARSELELLGVSVVFRLLKELSHKPLASQGYLIELQVHFAVPEGGRRGPGRLQSHLL